jgi:hypothetical protein
LGQFSKAAQSPLNADRENDLSGDFSLSEFIFLSTNHCHDVSMTNSMDSFMLSTFILSTILPRIRLGEKVYSGTIDEQI